MQSQPRTGALQIYSPSSEVDPCMRSSSTASVHPHAPPQGFIRKHVFSLDHKVIGKQYYGLALVAVFIGMVLSWLMRIHLGWPTCADSAAG